MALSYLFCISIAGLLVAVLSNRVGNPNLRVHIGLNVNSTVHHKPSETANSSYHTINHKQVKEKAFVPVNVTVDLELRKNLTVANVMLCSIMKNEELYVDEWLEYHRYLGFDHAHLFDNAVNASSYLASLPHKYHGFVKVTHMPGLGKQVGAYHTCVKKGSKSNTWAAFIDIDEFIVLRKHPNIKAFLQDVAPEGGSVVLNWSIMGSNGALKYDPAPVVTRFTLTSATPNQHVKTIAYLPHVLHQYIHDAKLKPGHPTVDQHGRARENSPFHPDNDREIAHINHYYTKSWEEFQIKRRRGFATNFHRNKEFVDDSAATLERIKYEYDHGNNITNAVEDTFARDFYLRHHLKPESKHLRRR